MSEMRGDADMKSRLGDLEQGTADAQPDSPKESKRQCKLYLTFSDGGAMM